MSYKTLIGSAATIAGISVVIIGLSVLHRRQLTEPATVAAASKGDASIVAHGGLIQPTLYTSSISLVAASHCNIERLDGNLFGTEVRKVPATGFELSGWVVDQARTSVPVRANIWLEKKGDSRIWVVPLALTIDRPDVVQSQGGVSAYLHSGFSARISPTSLPAGEYHLLIQYPDGGHAAVCDNGRHLRVEA